MMAYNPEVTRAFDAARDYDRHASVQRRAAERLAERIAARALPADPDVLEIGCGTGFLAAALRARVPGGDWLLTDIAPAMLDRCEAALGAADNVRYALLDGERPDVDGSFDLIVSSFTFQWFADLPMALSRLATLLRPGGTLAFATMADGSFVEWREAHHRATGKPAAMSHYPTIDALQAMAPAGLRAEIAEERLAEQHADAREFLRSLRAIGAHRPLSPRAPVDAGALRQAMTRFEAGGARISYHVAYAMMTRDPA